MCPINMNASIFLGLMNILLDSKPKINDFINSCCINIFYSSVFLSLFWCARMAINMCSTSATVVLPRYHYETRLNPIGNILLSVLAANVSS